MQKTEKAFDDCVVDTLENADKSEPQSSLSPPKSEILPDKSTRLSIPVKDNPISKQKAGQAGEIKEHSSLSVTSSKLRQPVKDLVSLKQSKSFDDKSSLQKMTALPASGRSFVKPAHYTAPFKTDPNLPVPKRRQLQKSAIRAPAAKEKISLHRNVEKRPAKSVGSKTGILCDTDLCENARLVNRVGNNERCDLESGVNDGDSHPRNDADEERKESFKVLGNIDSSASDVQKPTDSATWGGAAGNQKQLTLQSER